eukprot:gene12885-27173_t
MISSTAIKKSSYSDGIPFQSDKMDIYFPWRRAPISKNQNLFSWFKIECTRTLTDLIFVTLIQDFKPGMTYWEMGFFQGAEIAMRISALSIFDQIRIKTVANMVQTSTEPLNDLNPPSSATDDTNKVVPDEIVNDLSQILDVKLAAFYELAIEGIKKTNYEIQFDLIHTGVPMYKNFELIFSASRKRNMEGMDKKSAGVIKTFALLMQCILKSLRPCISDKNITNSRGPTTIVAKNPIAILALFLKVRADKTFGILIRIRRSNFIPEMEMGWLAIKHRGIPLSKYVVRI